MDDWEALRVFVDGAIMKPQLGGIATYTSELANALARRSDAAVCVATSTRTGLAWSPVLDTIELPTSVQGFARRLVWRERHLAALVSAWNASVVLAPTVELPIRRLPVPAIMVVQDVGAVQMPELYGRLRWLRFTAGIPLACRRADHVVCTSHATLAALRKSVRPFDTPCTVIGAAGRALPQRPRAPRALPYILNVGSMLAHKNVRTLVEAMADPALRDAELLLAGPLDDRERTLFEQWRDAAGAPSRITHLGFVTADELADLYAGAAVVALPSLYEGFGLPLLEAMQCGAPAVASSIPAHREVGGDAAIYVEEPLNPAEWARALAAVVRDPELNGSLSRKGHERASGVTWDAIAEEIVALAREVVATARPH